MDAVAKDTEIFDSQVRFLEFAHCPITPYMKGRSRIKTLFLSIVPDPPVGVLHEGARQRDAGVNVGRCPPKAWR